MPLFVRYFHVNTGMGLRFSVVGLTLNVRLYVITHVSFDIRMLSLVMTSFTSWAVEAVNSHFLHYALQLRAVQVSFSTAKSAVDPDCKFLTFAIVVFQANRNKNESNYKSKLLSALPIIYILHTCSRYLFCKKCLGRYDMPSAST